MCCVQQHRCHSTHVEFSLFPCFVRLVLLFLSLCCALQAGRSVNFWVILLLLSPISWDCRDYYMRELLHPDFPWVLGMAFKAALLFWSLGLLWFSFIYICVVLCYISPVSPCVTAGSSGEYKGPMLFIFQYIKIAVCSWRTCTVLIRAWFKARLALNFLDSHRWPWPGLPFICKKVK